MTFEQRASDQSAPASPASPLLFNRALHRLRLRRAAAGLGAHDFLLARVAADMAERLAFIQRQFPVVAEIGGRTAHLTDALSTTPSLGVKTHLLLTPTPLLPLNEPPAVSPTDSAPTRAVGRPPPAGGSSSLSFTLVADEEFLPLRSESLNLALCPLSLHAVNDLPGALIQIRRALKPDGLMIASLFGGETLTELRQALQLAEIEVSGGLTPRVAPFADVRDLGGLLQRAGFALPVTDTDKLVVRYAHPLKLLEELRGMGETNVLAEGQRPLSRAVLARFVEIYQERFSEPDGRVRATFEIHTATGWAPHASQQKPLQPGSAKKSLAEALKTQEQPAGEKAGPDTGSGSGPEPGEKL